MTCCRCCPRSSWNVALTARVSRQRCCRWWRWWRARCCWCPAGRSPPPRHALSSWTAAARDRRGAGCWRSDPDSASHDSSRARGYRSSNPALRGRGSRHATPVRSLVPERASWPPLSHDQQSPPRRHWPHCCVGRRQTSSDSACGRLAERLCPAPPPPPPLCQCQPCSQRTFGSPCWVAAAAVSGAATAAFAWESAELPLGESQGLSRRQERQKQPQ